MGDRESWLSVVDLLSPRSSASFSPPFARSLSHAPICPRPHGTPSFPRCSPCTLAALTSWSCSFASRAQSYIRVKRQKQTFFLNVEPSENVGAVKARLSPLLDEKLPPSNIRLIFHDSPLDDAKSLSDYKVENTNILYMVYKRDDGASWRPCTRAAGAPPVR